jgi:hypothetical protein
MLSPVRRWDNKIIGNNDAPPTHHCGATPNLRRMDSAVHMAISDLGRVPNLAHRKSVASARFICFRPLAMA